MIAPVRQRLHAGLRDTYRFTPLPGFNLAIANVDRPLRACLFQAWTASFIRSYHSHLDNYQRWMALSGPIKDFSSGSQWDAIDREFETAGAVIIRQFLPESWVEAVNRSIDQYVSTYPDAGQTAGAQDHKGFLGSKTLRLKALCAKFAWADEVIADERLVSWAQRSLQDSATSIQLATAELIQIEPGQKRQALHRDSGAWPIPRGSPILANAIVALTRFTKQNGATNIVPGSHRWEDGRRLSGSDVVPAEMEPGDVVLMHSDTLHGGGENATETELRRALSITYCAGWLRPVENNYLSVPFDVVERLSPQTRQLLGYDLYDGTQRNGVLLGVVDGQDPARLLF